MESWDCLQSRLQKDRAYNVVFGLFQAPYYAFSQTMMAELTPPGYDNMVRCPWHTLLTSTDKAFQFFGLFGLSNRASSMIGPNVIQAIIDNTGDNWKGFPFLFALCFCASFVIWVFVDVTAGRRAAVRWAEERRAVRAQTEGVDVKEGGLDSKSL